MRPATGPDDDKGDGNARALRLLPSRCVQTACDDREGMSRCPHDVGLSRVDFAGYSVY